MKETNIQEIKSMYFDLDALLLQPSPVYRLQSGGNRYYYDFDENQEPRFYPSVTTVIQNTLKQSPFLTKWIAEKGYEEAKEYTAERAHYGTFMHIQIAELLVNRDYDLDTLKDKLLTYITLEKIPSSYIEWVDELQKDVLSFAQFMIDYNIQPLAVEQVLIHPEKGYAGAIDIVCEMDYTEKGFWGEVYKSGTNKGEPKETNRTRRIRAMIDNKSGRKGFFESSELQQHAYLEMWNFNFPDHPVERVFNWSPKEWRKTPSYNFKDQTDSIAAQKWPLLLKIQALEDVKGENVVVTTQGKINLENGLKNNISVMTLSEKVKKAKQKKEEINDFDERIIEPKTNNNE